MTGDIEGAFITARWLPWTFYWGATATMLDVEPDLLRWSERLPLTRRTEFHSEALLERTGDFTARLTAKPALGRRRLPVQRQRYEIVFAQRDWLGLRAADADLLSVLRMSGPLVQFHFRLSYGIAIHKSGVIA